MIDLNQETVDFILKGFDVLTAMHEYNPSLSIDLSSLCLQASPTRHFLDFWPKHFIETFLINECKINVHKLSTPTEIFNALDTAECLEHTFENFLISEEMLILTESGLNTDDIDLDNIEEFPEVFNAFINFLGYTHDISCISISSSFLYSNSETTANLVHLLLFYLSDHLDLLAGLILSYSLKFNKENQEGTATFYIDLNEEDLFIEDFFNDSLRDSYVQVFLKHLNHIKERHSQI